MMYSILMFNNIDQFINLIKSNLKISLNDIVQVLF
jgi:hypothetical protein